MIIDAHCHFTSAPAQLQAFRASQLRWLSSPEGQAPRAPEISDSEIRDSIEANQLKAMRDRGTDLALIAPRALGMEHHVPDGTTSIAWAQVNNDLVSKVTTLFPGEFAGLCQLPQSPDMPIESAVAELSRCVERLGFVGCILNPDPSGGAWNTKPMTDRFWYPLYQEMVRLDVPAMIHVSASCLPALHATGAYYINADTAVFMQLLEGDLFSDFPALRFVIPHGGGAVPYHWGRYRGLAQRLEKPDPETHLMRNVFFDTCVYHRAGINLLFDVINVENLLYASEMLGAIPGVDPQTGRPFDDTKPLIDDLHLPEGKARLVYELNVRRVYPRLDAYLRSHGR